MTYYKFGSVQYFTWRFSSFPLNYFSNSLLYYLLYLNVCCFHLSCSNANIVCFVNCGCLDFSLNSVFVEDPIDLIFNLGIFLYFIRLKLLAWQSFDFSDCLESRCPVWADLSRELISVHDLTFSSGSSVR